MMGSFDGSIIHQTLTWAAGSLTCISDLLACGYTQETSVYSLIQRTSVVCTELDSKTISGRVQVYLCCNHKQCRGTWARQIGWLALLSVAGLE